MALSKAFTTVTPFSKLVALLMFISFPFIGFYLGIQFQKSITPSYPPLQFENPQRDMSQKMVPPTEPTKTVNPQISCRPRPACLDAIPSCKIAVTNDMCPPAPKEHTPGMKACTLDAKQCPDGSFVGRTGPNCTYEACPVAK